MIFWENQLFYICMYIGSNQVTEVLKKSSLKIDLVTFLGKSLFSKYGLSGCPDSRTILRVGTTPVPASNPIRTVQRSTKSHKQHVSANSESPNSKKWPKVVNIRLFCLLGYKRPPCLFYKMSPHVAVLFAFFVKFVKLFISVQTTLLLSFVWKFWK